jgi:outer membrane protein TolC
MMNNQVLNSSLGLAIFVAVCLGAPPARAATDAQLKALLPDAADAIPDRPGAFAIKTTMPLSLELAVQIGLAGNRTLLAAKQSLLSAQDHLRQTQALLFPTLSLNAGINGGLSSTNALQAQGLTGAAAAQATTSTWSVDPGVVMNYDIGIDGSKFAQLDLSSAQVDIAQLEVARQSLALRQQIAGAYYDVQSGDQQVRIAKNDLANSQESLKVTQVLKQAGVSTVFEIQRGQVQVARTQSTLVTAKSQQHVAERTLVQLIGLGFGVAVEATDPIGKSKEWSRPLNDTILATLNHRPEVNQAKLQETIARAQHRLAAAAGSPRLQLSAGADELALPGWAFGYSGGLNLSLPLFEGGASRAAMNAADADLAAATIRYGNTLSQLQLQVEQAYAVMESSKANISTTSAALQLAKDSLKSAQIRFEAGVGTQTDLIVAENDLTQADGNAIQAVLNYNRAIANLQALAVQ